jgi:starch synthase
VHNLAFQGVFPTDLAAALKLPAAVLGYDGMEYWGKLSFLKAAVQWCDHINTVSPTYAREIVTAAQGMGFDGLLRLRGDALTGIVNGIDDAVWNPATDSHIASPYSARRLEAKAANKAALQVELGLDVRVDAPLFCVVSRLTTQKGIDLLLDAMHALHARDAQLAVLGTGDRDLQDALRREAERHPRQVSVTIGFDEPLSHRLQAGADAIIVPSRFEPCGLTQLYGLRYGTLPVVARVGGLADTVIDANEAALRDGVATGFQFSPIDATQLAVALDRACMLFADRLAWQRVQRRAMTRDLGWGTAALTYFDLYRRLISGV